MVLHPLVIQRMFSDTAFGIFPRGAALHTRRSHMGAATTATAVPAQHFQT